MWYVIGFIVLFVVTGSVRYYLMNVLPSRMDETVDEDVRNAVFDNSDRMREMLMREQSRNSIGRK